MLQLIPQESQSRGAKTGTMLSERAEIAAATGAAAPFTFHSAIIQETFPCGFTLVQS
jgi:hypothetical protein